MSVVTRLRRATVQVSSLDGVVVGTAFLISSDPWLAVTCEHVAAAAGVDRNAPPGNQLCVRFVDSKEERTATVVGRLDPREDDLVVLHLDGPEPPALPEDVLALLPADQAEDHEFRSFGFRALDKYEAGHARGMIDGPIPKPGGFDLICEPIQITSQQIDHGMSGAPLWDRDLGLVVGVISETFYAREGSAKDRDLAWAVDGRVLRSFPPDAQPGDRPRPPLEPPPVGGPLAPVGADRDWQLDDAPEPGALFVGREQELRWLDDRWAERRPGAALIVAPAGQGKSTLVRHWLDNLAVADERPDSVFWWSFDARPSVDEFIGAAVDHFSAGAAAPALRVGSAGTLLLAAYVVARPAVLVLDGLEGLKAASAPDALRDVLDLVEVVSDRPDARALVLLTSRSMPERWDDVWPVLELPLLSPAEAVRLLTERTGSAQEAEQLATRTTAPLAVELLALHPETAERLPESATTEDVVAYLVDDLDIGERDLLSVLSLTRRPLPSSFWPGLADVIAETGGVVPDDIAGAIEALEAVGLLVRANDGVSSPVAVRTRTSAMVKNRSALDAALAELWWSGRRMDQFSDGGEWRPAETLEELRPAIESVFHLSRAGRIEDAFDRLYEGVYRNAFTLVNNLGEWAEDLELVRLFFPSADLTKEPLIEGRPRAILLNEAGLDLRMLGRPREAVPLFGRSAAAGLELDIIDLTVAALARQSETLVELGELQRAEQLARGALRQAETTEDTDSRWYAHATLAWPLALTGRSEEALQHYARANEIRGPEIMAGPRAVEQAQALWWAGDLERAQDVLDEAWMVADWNHERETLALIARVLGEMRAAARDPEASIALEQAVEQASRLRATQPLIQALTALGAEYGTLDPTEYTADSVLLEALRLSAASGWVFFEPAIRVALAYSALRRGDEDRAMLDLRRADALATQSGSAIDLALIVRLREAGENLDFYPLEPWSDESRS